MLPGVTVLERLVSGTRERPEKRLWTTLADAPTPEQAAQLQQLVVVPAGSSTRPSQNRATSAFRKPILRSSLTHTP